MSESTLRKIEIWVYGIVAAFVGGGASAVTATVTASMIAPEKFNIHEQLGNFLTLAGFTFLVNGILSTAAYLKQSPLPKIDDIPVDVVNQQPKQ